MVRAEHAGARAEESSRRALGCWSVAKGPTRRWSRWNGVGCYGVAMEPALDSHGSAMSVPWEEYCPDDHGGRSPGAV